MGRIVLGLAVGLVLFYLFLPVVIVVPISFSSARFLQFPPEEWSLRWYRAYFESAAWMTATRVSLTVAVATTVIATPIGLAAAYALHNSRLRVFRLLQLLLLTPLMVPIIIIAVGVFFVYAKIGVLFTIPGLIMAHVMLALPYVVVATLAGFQSYDMTQELVARSLGVNRLKAFLQVTLPQIRPSVYSGALFAFITSLDETVVALFISGGDNQTLTKRMFTALRDEIDPTIASISSLLILASLILVMLTSFARRSASP
jgi:putative spermidine/putrescine transport system permease protein